MHCNWYQGKQWCSGKFLFGGATPSPTLPLFSLQPLTFPFLPPQSPIPLPLPGKREVQGPHQTIFEIVDCCRWALAYSGMLQMVWKCEFSWYQGHLAERHSPQKYLRGFPTTTHLLKNANGVVVNFWLGEPQIPPHALSVMHKRR